MVFIFVVEGIFPIIIITIGKGDEQSMTSKDGTGRTHVRQ